MLGTRIRQNFICRECRTQESWPKNFYYPYGFQAAWNLWVDFDDKTVSDFSIDLSTEQPDYFGGHTLTIEVDEDKEMSFGGMNG